jgi:hypothetical protein
MGWRRDSSAGGAIWDTEPLGRQDLLCRDEELRWLMQKGRQQWKLINGRIARSGDPVAGVGAYTTLGAYPPNANAPTVANTQTATPGLAWWTASLYTPLLANAVLAPSAWRIHASGTYQLSTTAMTMTLLPFIGTAATGAAPTTHQDLGVSGAVTVATTAITSDWKLDGDLTIRSTGTGGTAIFKGEMRFGLAAVPYAVSVGTPNNVACPFGGTVATVDFTGATANYPGGWGLASWGTSGTETIIPQQIHWISL